MMEKDLHSCPLCGSNQSRVFDRRSFRNIPVVNRQCVCCGLVYQSPRMSVSQADEFHRNEYRLLHQAGIQAVDPREIAIQKARAQVQTSIYATSNYSVSNHLDIGCSGGLLMQAFRERFGCQTAGIEIDSMYRPYAQEQGLLVYEDLQNLPKGSHYDLISMSHVLEHLPDPIRFLSQLREEFLTSDGRLFLEVPNLYGHVCFELGHLISFSPHTLQQVLDFAGFTILKKTIHGLPRSKLIPLYINIIAAPSSNTSSVKLKSEKGVVMKRFVAMMYRSICKSLNPRAAELSIPGLTEKKPVRSNIGSPIS